MDLHAMLRARGLVGPATVLLLTLAASPAGAAIGNWQGEGNAQVRLIAVGIDENGRIAAGIEIAIDPGWKTYWRSPGDAGVAPLIDFSGSTNLDGPVVVEYPVPHRLDDGYAVTNVYENYVVLPLTAVSVDPKAETELVLSLDIGVCAEICIPEHYDLTLDLAPGESDESAATILADARRALPGRPEPGVFDVDRVSRVGGTDKRPVFEIDLVAPDAPTAEVFVEGPADWYPAMPKLVSSDAAYATFSIEFNRLGSKMPIGGNTFTVTVIANGRAIEDIVTLD
jgi:suppressor for copper-sensitivity B